MKFEFNWPSGFWENYVLICWWDSNMSDFGWKVKGQPWPLKLIYSHCLIRFNISSENNDFGFNRIENLNFSKHSPFKCIRKQIWPWRQGQPRIILWTNLVGSTTPMLHTKSQGHRPSGSGEEDFNWFLPYMGVVAIMVMWPEPFEQNFVPAS